jgi:hypothetical protein
LERAVKKSVFNRVSKPDFCSFPEVTINYEFSARWVGIGSGSQSFGDIFDRRNILVCPR